MDMMIAFSFHDFVSHKNSASVVLWMQVNLSYIFIKKGQEGWLIIYYQKFDRNGLIHFDLITTISDDLSNEILGASCIF